MRWKLREILFRLGAPSPDTIHGKLRAFVIGYGIATILYRLALYVGIAVLVYHMTFKILGIVLFAVEVAVFLLRPVWREMREWWKLKSPIFASRRIWISSLVFAGLAALAIVPWSTQVMAPAIIEPANYVRLFPSGAGEIRSVLVKEGQSVSPGDLLVVMASPRLEKELAIAEERLNLANERYARRMGDTRDQAATLQLEKEKISLTEKVHALRQQIEGLSVHATLSGKIVGLDPDLKPGRLLSREDEIGLVIQGTDMMIRGYVAQQDVWRVSGGNTGKFIPDDGAESLSGLRLRSIAMASSPTIELLQLSETQGGRIRAHPLSAKGAPAPVDAIHMLTLDIQEQPVTKKPRRGLVVIDGLPESLASVLARRALKVLIQETGA